MNEQGEKNLDAYRSFLILSEVAGDEPLSQREISRRLGIAVGLVNSYLKNLVAKGFVRIRAFPKNRYSYLLTPQGIAEKSRLAYEHLSYFTNLYTVARQDYLELFRSLESSGVGEVVFCGVDEVAEIAYLSLSETGLKLSEILDSSCVGGDFFGHRIAPISAAVGDSGLPIVITSLKRSRSLKEELLGQGISPGRIHGVSR